MVTIQHTEAKILKSNHSLLVLSPLENDSLLKDFSGSVYTSEAMGSNLALSKKTVYLCGDISKANSDHLKAAKRVFIIKELSDNYHEVDKSWQLCGSGQVPILIHGLGVYYRRFFEMESNFFERICQEHSFQSLTESNKPGVAHRTGLYLSPVRREDEALHFNLLRCSTNLSGPTENFCNTDRRIVHALNQEADWLFKDQAHLNHVLAQVYHNTPANAEQKQKKAKISAHSDKTKDMPANGIMAFCTFYDQLDKLSPLSNDPFDYGYKEISGLTRLHFRLKKSVKEDVAADLPREFRVTLYPNSVFFMPLSTNRLYTHAIQSSMLDAERLPTRLGYVVRCSKTEAIHKDEETFLKLNGKLVNMEPATQEGMAELRRLYVEENKSPEFIDYGDQFLFSMNKGDYLAPDEKENYGFRTLNLPMTGNLFNELLDSVQFEDVGKGRQGTVLVKNEQRGTPIVRTTTKYSAPAQLFQDVHQRIAQKIKEEASLALDFNNALIENYSNTYSTMGSHSDQAQDLIDESFIALFSCYKDPELANPPRKLVIESKEPGGDSFEIPLTHNSVVLFSLDTNRLYKHKIVLDRSANPPENQWLGITFRTSKTFVSYDGEQANLLDGTPLTLANEEQRHEFYKLRGQENRELEFSYPELTYTISPGDRLVPVDLRQKISI